MMQFWAIGLGGFAGAVLRFWISGWANALVHGNYPFGTFFVNILGSFLLGLLAGIFDNHVFNPHLKLFLTVGLLGAFTTFSTFSNESLALLQSGAIAKALIYIVASVILGVIAAAIGIFAGKSI